MNTLILTEYSKPRACIVLKENASEVERHAAQELNHHLEQIGGTILPVGSTPVAGEVAIFIGKNLAIQNGVENFDWSTLGDDGALVRAVNGNLILAGNTPRGTLYAVYELLETVLGCRWLTANFSLIPKRETIEIDADLDIASIPTFRYREPFFGVAKDADWASRNRVNGWDSPLDAIHGGKWEYAGFVHTFYELLSPKEYFGSHPEYFSEIDGERIWDKAQLCLSNPEVLEIVTENARQLLRAQPTARILSVSQNDWWNNCQCEKCRAIDEREGSASGSLIHFVNGVAERIEAEFPHVFVDTLAYTYTVKPPEHVRPRHNVIIRLCHMAPCCDGHPLEKCERNSAFVGYLEKWGEISPEVFIWDYFTNFPHYLMPLPNLDAICADIPHFAHTGATGVFCQGDGATTKGPSEFAELRAYLFAKILWNADLDGHAVINEFIDLFYGPAAGAIREYIELMHGIAREETTHFNLYDPLEQPFLTPEVLEKANAILDEAARLAEGQPEYSERVAVVRLSTEYVYLQRNTRYTISGDKYHLPGEELAQRAKKFLEQASALGIHALREGGQNPGAEAAGARDFDLITLQSETLKVTVAPQMGGRILSLIDLQTQREWMHLPQPLELDYPFTGGYEEYSELQWHSPGWRNEYAFEKTEDAIHLQAALENGLELQRSYILDGSTLTIESRLTNRSEEKIQTTLRSHPDFAAGDWSTLVVEAKPETIVAPWQNSTSQRGSLWLENSEKPNGAWSLMRDGSQLTIAFDESQVEKCLLDWNRDYSSICLELFAKTQWLEAGKTMKLEQSWTLSKNIS